MGWWKVYLPIPIKICANLIHSLNNIFTLSHLVAVQFFSFWCTCIRLASKTPSTIIVFCFSKKNIAQNCHLFDSSSMSWIFLKCSTMLRTIHLVWCRTIKERLTTTHDLRCNGHKESVKVSVVVFCCRKILGDNF